MRIIFEDHRATSVKRSLLASLVVCLACSALHVAKADDEPDPLALLVETLGATDEPAVRTALLLSWFTVKRNRSRFGLAGRKGHPA